MNPCIEGEALAALPTEGTTRAPIMGRSLLLIILAVVFVSCSPSDNLTRNLDDEEPSDTMDPASLTVKTISSRSSDKEILRHSFFRHSEPERSDGFGKNVNDPLLENYFKAAVAIKPNAAKEYEAALANLKKDAVKNFSTLAELYRETPENEYFLRWLVVDAISQLNIIEAKDALYNIAISKLPEEKLPSKHNAFSAVKEEVKIRLAAIQGLSSLAKTDKSSKEHLINIANLSNHRSLQLNAIWGYLFADISKDDQRRLKSFYDLTKNPSYTPSLNVLRSKLKKELGYLLNVKPLHLSDKNMNPK